MKHRFTCALAAAAAVLLAPLTSPGQESLAYSFETIVPPNGPDGFFGLGATVSQEPVIGVTEGNNSLKFDIGAGGFVGARTEVVPPALNDPPGVEYILFDLTLTAPYGNTLADIGVTIFGHALNAPGGATFGHQVQFGDTLSIVGLAAGTHFNLRIDLNQSVGPYRPGESFNDIFGPGPNDLTVPSAFQFFVSKNASTPLTLYIDNVRLAVPEPGTVSLLGMAALGAAGLAWRRRMRRL